jgi:hypothetical protein
MVRTKQLAAIEPEIQQEAVAPASERAFGIVFAVVFCTASLEPQLDHALVRAVALDQTCLAILPAALASWQV